MLTIQSLDVHFDVEGDTDEQTFTRLFDAHIRTWCRKENERRARQRQLGAERSLGDRAYPPEEM